MYIDQCAKSLHIIISHKCFICYQILDTPYLAVLYFSTHLMPIVSKIPIFSKSTKINHFQNQFLKAINSLNKIFLQQLFPNVIKNAKHSWLLVKNVTCWLKSYLNHKIPMCLKKYVVHVFHLVFPFSKQEKIELFSSDLLLFFLLREIDNLLCVYTFHLPSNILAGLKKHVFLYRHNITSWANMTKRERNRGRDGKKRQEEMGG